MQFTMTSDLPSPSMTSFSEHGSPTSVWSDYWDDSFSDSLEPATPVTPCYDVRIRAGNWAASSHRHLGPNPQTSSERGRFFLAGGASPDECYPGRCNLLDSTFSVSDQDSLIGPSLREPILLRTIASTISAFLLSPVCSPSTGHRRGLPRGGDELLNSPPFGDTSAAFDATPDFHSSSYHMTLPSLSQIQTFRIEESCELASPGTSNQHNQSSAQACCMPKHPSKSRSFSSRLRKIVKKFRIRVK